MATFVATARMSPALRARVEAAVRGKRVDRHRRWPRVAIAAGILTALILAGVSVARTRRERSEALETRRSALLTAYRARLEEGAPDVARIEQTRAVLLGITGAYAGDWKAAALDGADRAALLARPTVYMRAPLESFESELTLGHAAETSYRDAFTLCLHAPPEKRSEKALAGRAKAAMAGGAAHDAIAHVDRVDDALGGLRFLRSDWEARVRAAETEPALVKLAEALRLAPLEAAGRASRAELVLVVADEEKIGNGPTELDGACPHYARILLFDGETGAPLARLRRFVDPGKLGDDVRLTHANGINGCELALEARAAWGLPTPL